MMPAEPHQTENPVFSIHQADIICYGFDLADYLRREFNLEGRRVGGVAGGDSSDPFLERLCSVSASSSSSSRAAKSSEISRLSMS